MVKSNKKGAALIIFVLMILLTITGVVVGYSFLITHEMKSAGIELNEQKALYIAETAIERAMIYLENDTDWSNDNGTSVISESFDAGSYDVDLTSGTETTIIVEAEATVDSGPQQLTHKIRQQIRRLPEVFNYAVFSDSTNSLKVKGTVEINGGDLYARGDITDGTLNVSNGGTVSASTGGLVYSEGSVTASGTYGVGTAPTHTPTMPALDTTYYTGTGGLMTNFDSDINTYNTSASYLGYAGPWLVDPDGTVTITLSGNILYYENFKVKNDSSITGHGAIVSNDEVKMENTTSVSPAGGTILIISRNKMEIKDTSTIGANTVLYSKKDELKVKDATSVSSSTLLSADKIKIEGGTINNSTLYHSASSDKIVVKGSSTTISNSTLLSREKIEIKEESSVDSDSLLYITSAADKIEVKDINTSFDGSILSDSKFKLDKATITGIVFASEAELKEGTIYGSVIADSCKDNKIGSDDSTLTINYDHSYFPEAPAGLGLDIDGDVNDEGIIVKVPGTWEQL